jgi:sugar lactone lactonase YvrE
VADTNNQRIQHFSAAGQFLGQWGSYGSGDGQFSKPRGVAVGSDGTVYVTDWGNHRIQRFSTAGQFLGQWGSYGSADGQFNHPSDITISTDGTIYVADTDNYRIQHFSATGQFLGQWGSQGNGDGQFNWVMSLVVNPAGVVVASDGTVYVADSGNNRIQRFSATGQFLGKWGSYGSGDGQLNGPRGIAVTSDGTVYVADTYNHRIQRFSATGQFLGKWGSQGNGDGQFSYPSGVAVASDGTVYVADSGNRRIQRFSATGQFLGQWGSQGNGDGQFGYPSGVAVASDGTVYVADSGNHRIQRFSATGQFLGKWGSLGSGDGQLSGPWGVAVASDGTVYVADTGNNRIQRFSATGQFIGKWGSPGSGDGQFHTPSGMAVAPDGTIYVGDSGNNRIQTFGTIYPTTWRGEYFANRWLAEQPVLIRQESAIDFSWGGSSPGTGVPSDNFSARWQRYVSFDAGTYRFNIGVDDGARLWVDDRLLIEAWQDPQVATFQADVALSQGYHRVRLEYYEAGGGASVRLSWERLITAYLPIIVQNYYFPSPRPIQNPSFESELNYWQTAGVVVHSSGWKTHGQYAARLGDPNYWCAGGGVVGKNGVTQTFDVPYIGSTNLTFDYKIVTEDSLLEAGDYLQMELNDGIVGRIGWQQAPSRCSGQSNILIGTYSVDVLGLGHRRGASIKLGVFIVIVDQYYNTYGYIDNVRWGPPYSTPAGASDDANPYTLQAPFQ